MHVLFLNELSVAETELPKQEARERALSLVRVLRKIRSKQRQIAINSEYSLRHSMVDCRHPLSELLAGNSYVEERLLLSDIADRCPISEGLDEVGYPLSLEEQGVGYDFLDQEATALGWADQLDMAVLSFQGDLELDALLSVLRYEEGEAGELSEKCVNVRNFSLLEHITYHDNWLSSTPVDYSSLSVGDLWDRREELFPFLRFLGRVETDLNQLKSTGFPYYQALSRCDSLNQDIAKWVECGTNNREPQYSIKVAAGEHEQRRSLSEWEDEQVEGVKKTFNPHLYFDEKRFVGRIHFRLCDQEQKAVVAYIGRKLGA